MSEPTTFAEFLRRVRAGDAAAAAELVRKYEGIIRREVRLRLSENLQSAFDSTDICQSVLGSFFLRAASGAYDLESPQDLLQLLIGMTRHKFHGEVRRQQAQRRDYRRVEPGPLDALEPAADTPSPSDLVAGRELLDRLRQHLTADELRLADLRAAGRPWAEIAAEVGGTAEGRRKQFARAVSRVCQQLGLEESHDE
jgi:RNA polymerase sigma-70 factor (ECF subfamily)